MVEREFTEEELFSMFHDEKNQEVLNELNEKSLLEPKEKSQFEEEFFGQTDYAREFMEETPFNSHRLEDMIYEMHKKKSQATGDMQNLKDILREERYLKKEAIKLAKQLQKEMDVLKSDDKYGFKKIPPQDQQTEKIILSTLFKHPEWMEDFSQPYLNLMFYNSEHQNIHSAMMDLRDKLTPKRIETKLNKDFHFTETWGKKCIEDILNETHTDDRLTLKAYIEDIEQHYLARNIIYWATEVVGESFKGRVDEDRRMQQIEKYSGKEFRRRLVKKKEGNIGDFSEYIRNLSIEVLDLLPFRYRRHHSLEQNVDDLVVATQELVDRNGKPLISTGYQELDHVTHGLPPNNLILVGSRPKNGKTTFSVNVADKVLKQNKGVLFFTYELTHKQILEKLISKRTLIDSEKFKYFDDSNKLTKMELEKIRDASEEIKKLPLYLRGGRPKDLTPLVFECRQIKEMNPDISLIVFDGLQAFEYLVAKSKNKSDFFYSVLTTLKKDIAEDLDVTVILNAQLKSDVEKRRNKKPNSIDDFSDCKGIPEIADGAYLLWRPEHYFPDKPEFANWLNVHPIELRDSGKKGKEFKLSIDMRYAQITDYKG